MMENEQKMEKLAGKYLTFRLCNDEYGIQIAKVNQIIRMLPITVVPRTPECIRGVINLRGMIIPIINLRKKFEMQSVNDTERSCIIVIQIDEAYSNLQMGVVIDEVREVRELYPQDIEEVPLFGNNIDTKFLLGISKNNDSVIMLLDIIKLLTGFELQNVNELLSKKQNSEKG